MSRIKRETINGVLMREVASRSAFLMNMSVLPSCKAYGFDKRVYETSDGSFIAAEVPVRGELWSRYFIRESEFKR